jgi:hypothetical protein
MTALSEFLFAAPARRSTRSIIAWWEGRRLAYNAIVGTAGMVSLAVVATVLSMPPLAHEVSGLPFGGVIVVGVAANVCYFLGPGVEIAIEKLWGGRVLPTGPVLYRMGLTFSVGLVMLPTLIAGFDWVTRVLRWII